MPLSLYATATGMSGIKSLTLREGMSQPAVQVDIVCTGVTAQINDTCDIDFGYDTDHGAGLTGGLVKKINYNRPAHAYEVTVMDKISRAIDYFMAADNPESPFQAKNRAAELLVGDLLNQAGLTLSAYDSTIFTFGTQNPIPINLVSAWTYIEHINRITTNTTYALPNGNIEFRNRPPFIIGGDVSEHTFTTGSSGDILEIRYWKSDEKIRNKVVVYGAPGITATTSGSSPYLPSGFQKSLVIAHEIISNQQSADQTASLNLQMWNRLTETCTLTTLGNRNVRCRDIVDVQESFSGLSAGQLWVVFATEHRLSREGYETSLTLTR